MLTHYVGLFDANRQDALEIRDLDRRELGNLMEWTVKLGGLLVGGYALFLTAHGPRRVSPVFGFCTGPVVLSVGDNLTVRGVADTMAEAYPDGLPT